MNRRDDLGPETRVSLTMQQHFAVLATVIVIVSTVVAAYAALNNRLERIEDRLGRIESAAHLAPVTDADNAAHPVLADRR